MNIRSFCRITGLLTSASYAVLAFSGIAQAQTVELPQPPVNAVVDDKGVDLTSAQLMVEFTPLTIGDAADGLKETLYYPGLAGFRHKGMITATVDDYDMYGNAYGNHVTIATGDTSSGFTWNGSIYVPDKGDGSTLTFGTTKWIYTDRDGNVTELDRTQSPYYSNYLDTINYYGGVDGVATTVTRADGFKKHLTYKTLSYNVSGYGPVYVTRLQSTNNAAGFQVKYSYASNTLTQTSANDWLEITQEQAINNAVDYCDPTADSCSGFTQSWPTLTVAATTSGSNGILSFTNPAGRTDSYTFDNLGRIIGYRRPGAGSDTTTYGYVPGSTAISSVTLANIGTWNYNFSYDAGTDILSSTITTPTIPTPKSVTAQYGIRQALTVGDENGLVTTFTYDGFGRVHTQQLDGGSNSNYSTYDYDDRGNLKTVTITPKSGSGLGALTTSATFPDNTCTNVAICNKPITTTNSDGQVTNYYYNSNGTPDYVQLPAPSPGAPRPETHYGYYPLGAWFKVNSNSVTLSPDSASYLITTTTCITGSWPCASSNQKVVSYGYPGGPWPTNVLVSDVTVKRGDNTEVSTTSYGRDAIGNITSTTDPVGNVTSTVYNGDRQIYSVVSPSIDGSGSSLRRAIINHYNPDGLLDSVSYGSLNPSSQAFTPYRIEFSSYDIQGRKLLDGVGDAAAKYAVTQYSYNGAGRLDCRAQRMNPALFDSLPSSACTLGGQGGFGPDRITHYIWEYAGLLDRTQSAYGTILQRDDVHYTRTNHHLVETMTDPKGNVTAYVYDGHDRLSRTCYVGGLAACQANTSSDFVQLTYDAAGHLTNRSLRGISSAITIGYVYDKLGRVTNINYPGGGAFDAPVALTYDNLGRQLSASDTSGHSATYTYDSRDNVLTQGDAISTRSMQYDAANRRTKLTWPDGASGTRDITYEYNGASEIKTIRENGSAVLASFDYDPIGRRSSLARGGGVVTTTYSGYTPLGPATIVNDLAGTANDVTLSLAYNPAGQIVGRTTNSSNAGYTFSENYPENRSYAVNGLNQYTASGPVTPTYDVKGNLASAGTPSYAYSTKNELVSRTDTGSTFYHDPLGRLDTITTTSATTKFQYDGSQISTELNGSNAIQARYVWGPSADEPLVRYDGSDFSMRRYLVADERGSVIAVTDSSGNLVGSPNSYDEYGVAASTNQGRFQYTGQASIAELGGMYSYKARIYSSQLGRFLQPDPAGYPDGPNWYAYANNDPINAKDPSGLDVDPDGSGDIYVPGNREGGYISDTSPGGFGQLPGLGAILQQMANTIAYNSNLAIKQQEGGRQNPCSTSGPALGVWTGGSAEGGILAAGLGAQRSYSAVSLPNHQTAIYRTTGASAGGPGWGTDPKGTAVLGGAIGWGAGISYSNATEPSDLVGPADTWNVNVLLFSGSLSIGNNGVWSVNAGLAKGIGLDASNYTTNTDLIKATKPYCPRG